MKINGYDTGFSLVKSYDISSQIYICLNATIFYKFKESDIP